jgi:hypothetical protein
MVNDQHVETIAAEMVRVYGRHADLACERMIDKAAQGGPSGTWPKILDAVRKLQSSPA